MQATDRAADLRSALAMSSRLAADVDAVLGRYQAGLTRTLKTVGPTVERTQALRAARAEVQAALADAELTLQHLDAPRRVEAAVLAGPEADLPGFLSALAELAAAVEFLQPRRDDLPAAEAAVDSAAVLRRDGLALALRNFVTLLQLHLHGDGGGEDDAEDENEGDTHGRWRPSDEGAVPDDDDPAALDYDSEGSEVAAAAQASGGRAAASTSPSLFLRVAQPPLSKPAKATAKASALLPAPVTARLRALAVTLVGVGQSPCVKAYCDMRRGRLDASLAALAAPMPMEGAEGEGAEAVRVWLERWTEAVSSTHTIAASEVDLAAAIFDAPHAGEVAVSVLTRMVDLLIASVQEMIGGMRRESQALSFIVALGTLSPALAALDATLYDETFVRICKRLCDAQKTLEAAARAQLNDFLSPRTFSGAAYGGATINITIVARTLTNLEALLTHAPVVEAVCGCAEEGGAADAEQFVPPGLPAEQQAVYPAASAFILRALDALVNGADAKARAAKTKVGGLVFALNSVGYILAALKNSHSLRSCVPADHLARWQASVESALSDLRSTLWGPLVDLLPSDRPGGLSKDAAKSITASLQVIDEARASLAIVDNDLRSRVRDAVTAEVVEPYELLLSTMTDQSIIKHLRCSAADVRALVEGGDFFALRDDDLDQVVVSGGGGTSVVGGPTTAAPGRR